MRFEKIVLFLNIVDQFYVNKKIKNDNNDENEEVNLYRSKLFAW